MKEEILNNINMNDIVNKYGLNHKKRKMRCPFHGQDKHPSAQIYEDGFHCFTCGKHLDVIGFVEEYFNLDFKEAMQKINLDFNLGLKSNTKVDKKKLQELENKRKADERLFNNLQKHFCELCNLKFQYKNKIKDIDTKILITNWEELVEAKAMYQTKIEIIEIELDFLIDEMYNFKRTRF